MYYSKGANVFHIIIRISDAPGSFGRVLDLLGSKVNLVGTSTYTLGDGSAMVSAFAEALSKNETAAGIKKLLAASSVVVESEVRQGKDGLLVDTFHTGLEALREDYMLLRRWGMGSVFDHIVKIFGTGGEVLLYEEGAAMARGNLERTTAALSPQILAEYPSYLMNFLSAQGWGQFKLEQKRDKSVITVTDCFECAKGSEVRKKCDFVRGYLEGTASAAGGVPTQVEELQCTLKGGRACVFQVSRRE